MKQPYSIWDVHFNVHTMNWNGKEWVIDGERGRATYPGDLPLETVCAYYKNGIDYNGGGEENDAQRV